MKILLRTFNPLIQGKTGLPLKTKNFRDSSGWFDFESLIFECFTKHSLHAVPDHPEFQLSYPNHFFDISIKQHGTKKQFPVFDYFYMQMFHKYLFEFDQNGWGCLNSKKKLYKRKVNYITDDSLKKIKYLKTDLLSLNTKHQQNSLKLISNSLPEKYVLVPLQTPNDFVIQNFSPVSVIQFIDYVGKIAKTNKINFVIKLHPYCKRNIKILNKVIHLLITNKYIFLSDENIINLIKRASSVLTINSGVGFEALILSKPVFTIGDSIYECITTKLDLSKFNYKSDYFTDSDLKSDHLNWLSWYLSNVAYLVIPSLRKENISRLTNQIKCLD